MVDALAVEAKNVLFKGNVTMYSGVNHSLHFLSCMCIYSLKCNNPAVKMTLQCSIL